MGVGGVASGSLEATPLQCFPLAAKTSNRSYSSVSSMLLLLLELLELCIASKLKAM